MKERNLRPRWNATEASQAKGSHAQPAARPSSHPHRPMLARSNMRLTKLMRHVDLHEEGADEQHEIPRRADRLNADTGHIRVERVLQPGEQDWAGGVAG